MLLGRRRRGRRRKSSRRVTETGEVSYRIPVQLGGYFALLALFVWLQATFGRDIVLPDFLTMWMLVFALFGSSRGRYIPSMGMGLMRDLACMLPFGTFTVFYGLMHRLLFPIRRSIFRESSITQLLLAFVVVFICNMFQYFALIAQGAGIGWSSSIFESLHVAMLSAPLFPAMVWSVISCLRLMEVPQTPDGAYCV